MSDRIRTFLLVGILLILLILQPIQNYKELSTFFNKYKPIFISALFGSIFGFLYSSYYKHDSYVYFYKYKSINSKKIPVFLIKDTTLSLDKYLIISNYPQSYIRDKDSSTFYSQFNIYSKKGDINYVKNKVHQKINNKYIEYIHLSLSSSSYRTNKIFHFLTAGFFIGILISLYLNRNVRQ
jgi:hypothetical protein